MVETEKKENPQANSSPTCKCGHDKKHPMVEAKGSYTAWGSFLVLFGISYKPIKVRYQCLKCDQCFEESTDAKVLNNFY